MVFLENILNDCIELIEDVSKKTHTELPIPNFSTHPEMLHYLNELQRLHPNFRFYGENVKIDEFVILEGFLIIADNVKILPFTHIRGPSIINTYAKVKGEIKRSYIGKHTKSTHMSTYIGDSIIGNNCNFGAGTKCQSKI